MLSLRLKSGEYLTIGKDITVQVFQDRGNSIEVAIDAPRELPILRGKLFEQTGSRPEGLHDKDYKRASELRRSAKR